MNRLLPALAALLLALPPLAFPTPALAADEPDGRNLERKGGIQAPRAARAPEESDAIIIPFPAKITESQVWDLKSLHYSTLRNGNRNVLIAYGGVGTGDSVRFRQALDAARPVDEIVVWSPGGDLDEGLEIGRLIHARKLATHILRGMACVSACNFIFMGGVVRYVDQGGSFKVHMFSDNSADILRRDIVLPPHTYEQLLRKYKAIDFTAIIETIMKVYPNFEFDGQKFRAARATVTQQNKVDVSDSVVVNLEAVRTLVADYNRDHPDKPISDSTIILTIVMSQDVKMVQMDSAEAAANIARYLTEMSLSLRFLTRFAAIHNDQPTDLTRAELREFNVINTD